MTLKKLDHVNIRTPNLDRLVDFYGRVLGLVAGPRPAFRFPGAWLYCGQEAVIHLVGVDERPVGDDIRLSHFAFRGEDIDSFLETLRREEVTYRIAEVPGFGITQVNLFDPDGNHLHVDFKVHHDVSEDE